MEGGGLRVGTAGTAGTGLEERPRHREGQCDRGVAGGMGTRRGRGVRAGDGTVTVPSSYSSRFRRSHTTFRRMAAARPTAVPKIITELTDAIGKAR